jgi:hypothetical protein
VDRDVQASGNFFGVISEDSAHASAELIEIDLKVILAFNQAGRI